MKVYLINTVCGVGSTGKITAALLHLLKEKGHEGRIAYGVGEAKAVAPGESFRIVSGTQYYAHNLLSRLTGREGLYSTARTKALVADIRRYDPDVIHLHNLHGHYLNYEVLFRYLAEAGKRVVWTLHDCWALTGHCTHFMAVGCEKWKHQCENCTQLRQYPQCYTRSDVSGNYRKKKAAFTSVPDLTLVTPSRWMAQQVQASFLGDYPVQVIHNGIDLSVFRPVDSGFRKKYHCEDKFILLGVSFGWGARKGLDVFIELAKRLDERYQIILVGTNETVDRQLPENIISIHRTQNQQELAEIYTAADLLVNPTREEAFGLVNAEAMACGTPVLTFRTGGSPEVIDESSGAVVECDDIDAMEAQIRRIEAERLYTAEACMKRAAAFNVSERFEEYIRLYVKKVYPESREADQRGY